MSGPGSNVNLKGRGLGRGLGALIPKGPKPTDPASPPSTPPVAQGVVATPVADPVTTAAGPAATTAPATAAIPEGLLADFRLLPLDKVVPNPGQPRKHFDDADLHDLAASIAAQGVLQPVIVRARADGTFQLISGERRYRASAMVGLAEIPARIVSYSDREALLVGLIENVQRADLSPLEEARGYAALRDEFGLTQDQISERVGKARSSIAGALAILSLPVAIQTLCETGELSRGHLKALLGLRGSGQGGAAGSDGALSKLAEKAAAEGWSVRVLEEKAREATTGGRGAAPKSKPAEAPLKPEIRRLLEDVERSVGTKVTLRHKPGAPSGQLTLHYNSVEELGRIIRKLKG
jgi:ParB family transcriptional regulator, chromosome partitioning protein